MTNSIGLGLSREYALRKMILPVCFPELLGTVALGMAYGMGAVAPILYTGAVMQAGVPSKLTDPFMSLPYHLYTLVNNGFSLDYVPNEGREADVKYVLSNSLGFGGHNGTLIMKKYED